MATFALALVMATTLALQQTGFDRDFASYRDLLARVVHGAGVDYRALAADRAPLDRIVTDLGRVATTDEAAWPRDERLAFWINAYNILTLRSIVDHYPIRGSVFSFSPRNSIRQIDGVWTKTRWAVAGRSLTLDGIEHTILRPVFKDPRVHMAINCASKGCPPLWSQPYAGRDIDRQLDEAARRYLATGHGVQASRGRLVVSSIFKWYGADFTSGPGDVDAAIRRFVARYGPPPAVAAANANARVAFLPYDWSLNDTEIERRAR